jgi:hypothetical protein
MNPGHGTRYAIAFRDTLYDDEKQQEYEEEIRRKDRKSDELLGAKPKHNDQQVTLVADAVDDG